MDHEYAINPLILVLAVIVLAFLGLVIVMNMR